MHRFRDPDIEQRLLPPHGDNAHRIIPGHLEVADRTAPVVPCAALATVAEPDAHRLLLGQHGLHRAVGIRDVQLAARDDGTAAQREHDARRAQHFQPPNGAADVEAFDHTCFPAASIISVSASGVFLALACSVSSFGVGVLACAFSILVTGGLCSTNPSVT